MTRREPDERRPASPEEIHLEAAAINDLLGKIGLSSNESTAWWNLVAHRELDNRTATEAWLAGDTEAVRTLVERWYEASKSAANRASGSPEFLLSLRQRLAELDERVHSSLHRTA